MQLIRPSLLAAIVFSFLFASTTFAAGTKPVSRTWTIDGVAREAHVYLPADAKTPAPLVFAFHGHGGSIARAEDMFHIHELWPEAVVVYPQGLNTPGRLSDPEGKRAGWQQAAGDQNDRDLKFFDAMLKSLVDEKRVDPKRVFVTGHSNGGAYTYLLWAERGDHIAAVAPSGALDPKSAKKLKPKPALHIAGKHDPLVKFEWQQKMIDAVLEVNQCDPKAGKTDGDMTTYASRLDTPTQTYLWDGGHGFSPKVAPEIVKFFQKHQLKPTPAAPSKKTVMFTRLHKPC